ncbi:MAG TPA: protease inhibitor I42 family protein [Armatimonadota bacterium]
MRRVLGVLAMVLVLGVAVPSWAGGPVTPKLVVLRQVGQEACGGDVALEVGELLEVVLPENASTGFQWEYAQKINGDVLRTVDSYTEVTSDVPGAPGL